MKTFSFSVRAIVEDNGADCHRMCQFLKETGNGSMAYPTHYYCLGFGKTELSWTMGQPDRIHRCLECFEAEGENAS